MSTLLLYFSISCFGVHYSYKASSMNSLVVRFESTLLSKPPFWELGLYWEVVVVGSGNFNVMPKVLLHFFL